MGFGVILIAGLIGGAAIYLIGRESGAFGRLQPHARPLAPLDEAERILSFRYAKGEISPDEYERMLAILRR